MTAKRLGQIMMMAIAVLVIALIVHFATARNTQKDQLISTEDIMCISAVCLDSQLGAECVELKVALTHVALVIDANSVGAKRLVIRPTGKQCR